MELIKEIDIKIKAYKDALKQLELVNKLEILPIDAIISIESKIKKLERQRNAIKKRTKERTYGYTFSVCRKNVAYRSIGYDRSRNTRNFERDERIQREKKVERSWNKIR